eukprot:TRINITY_DN43314_c0_g1_i1.p1 TRINITY_DN43314_c0_g1~~TRINITY_DN43314_c0_g1_i1.p1  ORF type:complete len:448 (-),score=56.73 TRINITY_DN43314_c0_g1_i1:61-1404(-)
MRTKIVVAAICVTCACGAIVWVANDLGPRQRNAAGKVKPYPPPKAASQYADFIGIATATCYERLSEDSSCCVDGTLAPDVHYQNVSHPAAAWSCTEDTDCDDDLKGERGIGRLWYPAGASCSTPRILYVHGGSWMYGSPHTSGYPALCSRIASATQFVVFVPDYPLIPIGNASTIIGHILFMLDQLSFHGPHGDCSNAPTPPLFIGGDSSGGGTAFSALVATVQDATSWAPGRGRQKLSGAFLFSPWTNLKCDTPDYYFNAFAEIPKDENSSQVNLSASVGDVVFRGRPLANKQEFVDNALSYVGSSTELLMDPALSPVHATPEQAKVWSSLPPLYIAVGGSESILGDSTLVAQRTAQQGVEVHLDIYQGMWHVFPMYAEGCGGSTRLWQADSAIKRVACFLKKIEKGRNENASSSKSPNAGAPITFIHYTDPNTNDEWFGSVDKCD